MDPIIQKLAQQLLAQSMSSNPGVDWNQGGIDRAVELATMLANAGVTDLSQLSIDGSWTPDPNAGKIVGGAEGGEMVDRNAGTGGYRLKVGDQYLGNLGSTSGINDPTWREYTDADGIVRQERIDFTPEEYLKIGSKGWDPDNGMFGELAWSPEGKGHVGYKVVTGPDGKPQILPEWGSSSDMDMIRPVLAMAALAFGGGALMGGMGGSAGAAGAASGGLTASQLAAADMALGGLGGSAGAGALSSAMAGLPYVTSAIQQAAPIIESQVSALGPGATATDVAKVVSSVTGIPEATVTKALKTLGVNGLKSLVGGSGGGGSWVDKLLGPAGIGGATQVLGGLSAVDDFRNIIDEGVTGIRDTGQEYAGALRNQAQTYATGLRNEGATAASKWNNLATKGQGMFNQVADRGQGDYAALARKGSSMMKDFTPWALTTNLGSSDAKGNFKLNAMNQGVNDAATLAAQRSYGAANNINLNDLRNQEFGLMKRTWADNDESERLANEARQIAQGRGGLQSFSAANSFTHTDPDTGAKYTVGANPYDVALEKGIQARDLEGYLRADENAMARYTGLLSAGDLAMRTPFNYNTAGMNTVNQGATLGRYQSDVEQARANLFTNTAGRGIDFGNQTRLQGVTSSLGDMRTGLTKDVDAGFAAVDALNQGNKEANKVTYDSKLDALKIKMGGEERALKMIVRLYEALGNSIASLGNTSGQSKDSLMNKILGMLKGQTGMSEAELLDFMETKFDSGDIGTWEWNDGINF